mgnify:CR=1 FL=1
MSKITERLAKHVADFGVMYVKLHNYHWHVSGVEFKAAHEMTESYYEEVSDAYDKLAERLLQLGEVSPASLKEYLTLSSIKEETGHSFCIVKVVTAVKADFEYLLKELHETQKLASESGDCTTDGIVSGIIESFEKHVWMLSAMLKK